MFNPMWLVAAAQGLDFLGGLWGSKEEADANKTNTAFQLQRQGMMQDYFNRMVTPGMNPFAQAMLNFTGQGLPGAVNGFNPMVQYGGPQQTTSGNPPTTGNPYGIYNNPMYSMGPQGSSSMSFSPQQGGGAGQPNNVIPNYDGSASFASQGMFDELGLDPMSLPPGSTLSSLVKAGIITQQQAQQYGNPGNYDYANDPAWTADADQWINFMAQHGQPGLTYEDVWNQTGPLNSNVMGLVADDEDQFKQWLASRPNAPNNPNDYNPDFQAFDPTQQTGWDAWNSNANQGGGGGYGNNAQMYRYNEKMAPGYAPALNTGATGTQGMNAGQDALMQMMRKNLQPAQDPGLSLNLQQLGQGNTQYGMSDLFKSIDDSATMQLDDQLAQLHGSAGSLGQRYGSAHQNAEAKLRSNFLTNLNAQKQQIGFQGFEAAQGRRQPALDLGANMMNMNNQFNLGAMGLQQQAASSLAGFGQQGAQLNLQAMLANQDARNQASQFNIGQQTLYDQFGAQQGNIWNNLMMQALSQAGGMQANQQSQNASLLGILGGVGVPQTQPTSWGNVLSDGSSALMLPWLMQQMGKT